MLISMWTKGNSHTHAGRNVDWSSTVEVSRRFYILTIYIFWCNTIPGVQRSVIISKLDSGYMPCLPIRVLETGYLYQLKV